MNWQLLWESAKEPLRLLLFAVIAWAIAELAKLDTQWAIVGTFVLRFVDKLLHETGKATKNDLLVGGLSRF